MSKEELLGYANYLPEKIVEKLTSDQVTLLVNLIESYLVPFNDPKLFFFFVKDSDLRFNSNGLRIPRVPVAVTFKSGYIFADSVCACAQIIEMENSCKIVPREVRGIPIEMDDEPPIEASDEQLIIIDEDCGGSSQNVILKTWGGIAGNRILTIVGNCTKHVFKKVVEKFYKENTHRICVYKDKALLANGLWSINIKVTQEYWKEIWERTALRKEKIYLYFSQPKDKDTVTFIVPKEAAFDDPDSWPPSTTTF